MRKLGFEELKKLSKAVQLVSDKAKTQRLNFSGSKNLCLFYHPRGWHLQVGWFPCIRDGQICKWRPQHSACSSHICI